MKQKWYPIFQSVPADEFTDRQEIIAYLLRWAANTARDITLSTAVIGQRRLGKTAVLEQIYNRLFWEQDKVVPIYFTFEASPVTSTEFAFAYYTNFLRQYVAFRRKDYLLARLTDRDVELKNLVEMAESLSGDPVARHAGGMFRLLNSPTAQLHDKLAAAVHLPRQIMEYNRGQGKPETPIFVMLDEFQEVLKIDYSDGKPADTVGLYQWAVEGRQCPHYVTGSAIRLITQEVLGTGALFGRFRHLKFPPMEAVYGLEMVDNLATKYGLTISEPVAGYLVNRCGGNPFYIRCVLMQAIEQQQRDIPNEGAVSNLIAREVTRGQIAQDWAGQLQKYFETTCAEPSRSINSYTIAKRIIFYAAKFGDRRIPPEEIAAEVKRPVEEVQYTLKQLSFAEMLDGRGGNIYYNIKDPILKDFINTQYELDIEGGSWNEIYRELMEKYQSLQGKYSDLLGALVEARLEALLNRFDGRTVPGRLFNTTEEVELPKFVYVGDTYVKPPGSRAYQIDLEGEWYKDNYDAWVWAVEVKWWKTEVTPSVVKKFVAACEALQKEKRLAGVVRWLVNQGGFSKGAKKELDECGVYYSGPDEINELLYMFGIERLLKKQKVNLMEEDNDRR